MYKRQRITYNLNAYPTQSYLNRARTYWGFRHQGQSRGREGTRGGNAAASRIQRYIRAKKIRAVLARKPFTVGRFSGGGNVLSALRRRELM